MTATITDLFCGAGGSSLGAQVAGATIVMAANHWQTAIDVHQAAFPDAGHDCADISQADPRRYPRTDILLASPECTNHSQARGVSRKRQDPTLWDAPDPTAERSRATMWDPAWVQALTDLGYLAAHCSRCDLPRTVRQAFKNGRTVGRYRQQWVWSCTTCHTVCEPSTEPAASIIDWTLDCPRIGDRARPLAPATRSRILAGLQRYGWAPITTSGAGNVHERTPGNRARSIGEPLPVQQTTATTAIATPPGFLYQTAHGGRVSDLGDVHPTVCASDDRQALVLSNNFANVPTPTTAPLATATTGNRHALVVPLRRNGRAAHVAEVTPTITAGGTTGGLLMRNNKGGAEMITPTSEPARTLTTAGHQSLLVPYNNGSKARPTTAPMPTATTRDRVGLLDPDTVVDDCGFRMLEPYEVAAAMAFPAEYIPRTLPKKDQVKLAGNAVTPPVMTWIVGRILQALEVAG